MPKWDGQSFVFDGQRTSVLEYSENFAGWSDELTALHEEAAGDKHPIDIASRKNAITQVRRCLPAVSSVIMEIGCSSGFLIKDLIKSFPGVTVVGADVVKEPLYRLARVLPGVPLIRFDLLKCPLPDQSFDVLVMLNVLEHIEDDVSALKNALKLLKPGGSLVIEVPAGRHLYNEYDRLLCHFRRYSAAELNHKLSEAGFIVLNQSYLGFILYPAFVLIKLLSKWSILKKNPTIVRDQATSTSVSFFVKWLMKLETNYLSNIRLPFGIRALAVARRPECSASCQSQVTPALNSHFLAFMKFCLVGSVTAAIFFFVMWLVNKFFAIHYTVALSFAYSVSTVFHFVVNRNFTFIAGQSQQKGQIFRYLIMWLVNYLITIFVVGLTTQKFDLSPYVGACISILITICISYILGRFWVFKVKEDT